MSGTTSAAARQSFDRPIYLNATPLASKHLTGIGRYTARLALSLAARGQLRFFDVDTEIRPSARLNWSPDQDLAVWARQLWCSGRKRLTPEANSVAIHTCLMPRERTFGTEVCVIHDLTPLLLPGTHLPGTIRDFQTLFGKTLALADFALADSHSTKADAGWLCDFPQDKIAVGYPGASLCVDRHLHREPTARRPEMGLVVGTLEPRKNARFLVDWFAESPEVPAGSELVWVGAKGWMASRLGRKRQKLRDGRSIRFAGVVDDRSLCRLYRTAGWMAYPSLYEGFGFPVLDALRHGLPVLCAGNSSLREFAGPGVTYFDPLDPASLDRAFQAMKQGATGTPPDIDELDQVYSWGRLVDLLLARLAGDQVASASPSSTRAA